LNLPAPSTRLSRHRSRLTLEPSEPRRPPRSDRQAQAAPLGSIPIACLGRYQEPSPRWWRLWLCARSERGGDCDAAFLAGRWKGW